MPTPKVSFAPSCEIDLDAEGKQHGYLRIQFSSHRSAYGWLPVPIMTIQAMAEGPTALLIGANHGDEYEGISIIADLYQKLEAVRCDRPHHLPALRQRARRLCRAANLAGGLHGRGQSQPSFPLASSTARRRR